ncbi:MAG: hypothetical protein ACOYL4_03625 [Miltoncostaeaceae bacterium]|jgi:hypothetical protein
MPTTKPRHAVTETGAVAQALAELRAEPGGEDVPISELVVIGARTLAAEKRADRQASHALRAMLAERVLAGGPALGDPVAADEVRRTGWAREA